MDDSYQRRADAGDTVDTRRYVAAIQRDLPLILSLAVILTVIAFGISMVLPKTYSASALVGFDLGQATGQDSFTQERNVATEQELVTGRLVLLVARERLADEADLKVDAEQLLEAVEARVVPGKNVLEIVARSEDPEHAAQFANAVADAYVVRRRETQRASLDTQVRNYERSIREATTPELRQQYIDAQQQVIAQREAADDRVSVARAAAVPGGPDSPRPIRNAVLAFFAGIFIGILVALIRDQIRPRFHTPRDLAQFLDVPLLATVPELGRRWLMRSPTPQSLRVEQEAYRSLSAALRLSLQPTRNHVLMLTSSVHAEGKTTVASRLATLLASSGHPTLLVSGDLRWPRADEVMKVEGRSGLSDLLAAQAAGTLTGEQVAGAIVRAPAGGVDVLPAGTQTADAARLLSGGAVDPVVAGLRQLGYTYVIVDAPPLLGIADAMLLGRACDHVLVVSRLERISVTAAWDLRDELERLAVPAVGAVVIGGVTESSPYYSGIKGAPGQTTGAAV